MKSLSVDLVDKRGRERGDAQWRGIRDKLRGELKEVEERRKVGRERGVSFEGRGGEV